MSPEKYLTEAQQTRLLAYVKAQADIARHRKTFRAITDEMIIVLFLYTGLRAQELCRLQLRDLPVTHGKNAIFVRTGKRKVTRTIEISERLAKDLERFIKAELSRRKTAKSDKIKEYL